MKRGTDCRKISELDLALSEWREALKRFDSAAGDEVRYMALEVEAAKQRYMFLLSKRREKA